MSKTRIKLNSSGVRALLQSPEMMQECKDIAYAAQSKLGAGYEVTYRTGKYRARAEVAAVSAEARRENYEQNTLIKAVMGG